MQWLPISVKYSLDLRLSINSSNQLKSYNNQGLESRDPQAMTNAMPLLKSALLL